QEGLVSWQGNALAKYLYFSLLFSTLLYFSLPYSLLRAICNLHFSIFNLQSLLPPIAKTSTFLYFTLLFSTLQPPKSQFAIFTVPSPSGTKAWSRFTQSLPSGILEGRKAAIKQG